MMLDHVLLRGWEMHDMPGRTERRAQQSKADTQQGRVPYALPRAGDARRYALDKKA